MEFSENTFRVAGNTVVVKNVSDIRESDAAATPTHLNTLYVWLKGPRGWQLIARQPVTIANPNARGGRGVGGR